MKRFWAIVLTLCMLFTQENMIMFAAEVTDSMVQKEANNSGTLGSNNGFNWTYDAQTKTLTITGEDSLDSYDISPFNTFDFEIEKIVFQDCVFKERMNRLFFNQQDLKEVKFIDCNTSEVTDMSEMFSGCTGLTSLDVSGFDTSNVTNMKFMFVCCESLTSLDVSSFDTSNVENMAYMFWQCKNLTSLDVSGFDTSRVKYMDSMFSCCYALTSLDVSNFDTSEVTDMSCMFEKCLDLTSLDVGNFNTSKVTDMSSMFYGCRDLTSLDVGNFNTSNVVDMLHMFSGCSSLMDLDLSSFNTSNVIRMLYMFMDCTGLTVLDLSSFSIFNNKCVNMLQGCSNLKTIHTPKEVAEGSSIDLYREYCDTNGNTVTQITSNNCNMILEKKASVIPVPEKPYKITNVVSGVHVYWKSVDDAEQYGVWRSETGKNGEYKWIANPTTAHFTDTKVESGKTYYYKITVCDISTDKQIHGEKSEAIGIAYTSTPDITTRINKAAGIQLGWKKIEGATGYMIYRKSYSGSDEWKRIATIKDPSTLTYTDASVKNNNGSIYKYTIRALYGNTLSGCRNTGRTMVRLRSQTLKSAAKSGNTAIKCSWTTSKAVTGYEVRFMVGKNIYKIYTVGNYKTGVKTFANLPKGKEYKIQVRTYKKVEGVGTFYSAWSVAKNVKL